MPWCAFKHLLFYETWADRSFLRLMIRHDIAMTMKGQPARDLCRHFIQRWNHLLRIKNHSMAMPFLVPPPDYSIHELSELGLTGTCEIQVCRSCGPCESPGLSRLYQNLTDATLNMLLLLSGSMGTPSRVEHSIQNAYLKGLWIALLWSRYSLLTARRTISHSAQRTLRLHREPILYHLDRRRGHCHREPNWRRAREPHHPGPRGGHPLARMHRHPELARVPLPNRHGRGQLGGLESLGTFVVLC